MDASKMSGEQKSAVFLIGAIFAANMADATQNSMKIALNNAEDYLSVVEERYGPLENFLDE